LGVYDNQDQVVLLHPSLNVANGSKVG
jgi:hypothetical protein